MIFVPLYVLVLVPPLNVWWTHKRCDRREWPLLAISFLIALIVLIVVAQNRRLIATRHDGPLAASGVQIDNVIVALILTTLMTVIPVKLRLLKLLRDVAAVIVGEVVMFHPIWIS